MDGYGYDLMKGNYLHVKGDGWVIKVMIIDAINVNGMIVKPDIEPKRNTFNYDELEPIPITDEVLGKCGFDYKAYKYISDDFVISFEYGSVVITAEGEVNTLQFRANECRHLHQLQNLFYSLTGTELNYQP